MLPMKANENITAQQNEAISHDKVRRIAQTLSAIFFEVS